MSNKNTPLWTSVSRWVGLRSDAAAKVARRATESVNECRPTRLLFATVWSKAAPSAKKLAPIGNCLDEKGSATILRTKFGCRHDMRGDIGQLLGRPFEDPLIARGVICTAIVISDNDLRLNADSHGRSGTGRAFMGSCSEDSEASS
jgi:hypothetical protein